MSDTGTPPAVGELLPVTDLYVVENGDGRGFDATHAPNIVDATSQNEAPTAVVTASIASGSAPLDVSFDGSASSDPDGSIVTFEWDFDDGSNATGNSAEHLFESEGTYEVILTVTDNLGLQSTDSIAVTVEAPVDEDPVAVDDTLTTSVEAAGSAVSAVVTSAIELPADVVFAIDESGSMGPSIADVKANASTIAAALAAGGLDARLGLVGYGADTAHTPGDFAPHIHTALTDVASFDAALDELVADGGTEPGFDATVLAMSDAMDFRPGSGVCLVLITDEDSNGDTASRADAIDALGDREASFFGIIPTDDPIATAQYGPDPGSLAEATGGAVFDISDFQADPTPVLNALLESCVGSIVEGINLVPAVAENFVGDSHTVTATVKDSLGAPVVGTQVDFEIIAGPHAGATASAVTDSLGEATFSYTGTSEGEDTIQASFVDSATQEVKSATATSTWIPIPEPGVALTKLFDVDSVAVGDGGTFALQVTNTGDVDLSDVVVTDTVAGLLTVTGIDCAGTPTTPTQDVECALGTLEAGSSSTITVDFEVEAAVVAAGGVSQISAPPLAAASTGAVAQGGECPAGTEPNPDGVCTSTSIRPLASCWLDDGTQIVEIRNIKSFDIEVDWEYDGQSGVVVAPHQSSAFVTIAGGPTTGDFHVTWVGTQHWWIEITDELCDPIQEIEVPNTADVVATSALGSVSATASDSVIVFGSSGRLGVPETSFGWNCEELTCEFTDTSTDDAPLAAWEWDFGDGATSSLQNPVHTFAAPGTYPVTLTVTDADGLTSSAAHEVTVYEPPTGTMHVADLDATTRAQGRLWHAFVTILVVDDDGQPVGGAVVTGQWTRSGLATCTTGPSGTCTVEALGIRRSVVRFTITDVVSPTLVYDPALNTDPDRDSDGTSIRLRRP